MSWKIEKYRNPLGELIMNNLKDSKCLKASVGSAMEKEVLVMCCEI